MNSLVIYNSQYPLASAICEKCPQHIEYAKIDQIDFSDIDLIFDCTLLHKKDKEKLHENLQGFQNSIIADLSTLNGETFISQYQLAGAFSLAFYSPTNKVEYYLESEYINLSETVQAFLQNFDKEGIQVNSPGFGFTYPRVITQIINEAYYALEENLAEAQAIDTAMQFGVNYPLGPLEWSKKIGLGPIIQLLENLYDETQDKRYLCSSLLKEQSQHT